MKQGIHPQLHAKAKTTCSSCNNVFLIPSTIEEQAVETCRLCHPIYTGEQRTQAKGGRIERFKQRAQKAKKK